MHHLLLNLTDSQEYSTQETMADYRKSSNQKQNFNKIIK